MDSVKRDLERSEVNSGEWERMAEDRDGWRQTEVVSPPQGTKVEEEEE